MKFDEAMKMCRNNENMRAIASGIKNCTYSIYFENGKCHMGSLPVLTQYLNLNDDVWEVIEYFKAVANYRFDENGDIRDMSFEDNRYCNAITHVIRCHGDSHYLAGDNSKSQYILKNINDYKVETEN